MDEVAGVLVVGAATARLTREEAACVRAWVASGQPVRFATRHQWRHFQVRGV